MTNRISFEEATDLLSSGSRACIGFVHDGDPRVEPAVVHYDGARFLVCTADRSELPTDCAEVVLVVDDGVLFFDLRAIYIRGTPRPRAGVSDEGRAWFELEPSKVACWDYGRLRACDGDC